MKTCFPWPFLAAIKTLRAIIIAIDKGDIVLYRNPLLIFQMARADKFSQVTRKREFLPEQKAQQTQLLNRNIGRENGVKSREKEREKNEMKDMQKGYTEKYAEKE